MIEVTASAAIQPNEPLQPAVVAVYVPRHPERFVPTLQSLTAALDLSVVLGVDRLERLGPLADWNLDVVETWSPASLVNDIWREWRTNMLVVSDPVLVPPGFLDIALGLIAEDLRVGTVSFLSNDSAFLSFPFRNHPIEQPIKGHDAASLTELLRTRSPAGAAVPIPLASGAAVLISGAALGTVGPLRNARSGNFEAALADLSCRARSRGFHDVLDPTTFYTRPADLFVENRGDRAVTGLTPEDNGWLHEKHPMANPLAHCESTAENSALGLALRTARAKVLGLRVLVDGSCLGPQEMGTQVATIALVGALAASEEIGEVCVALPGPVPDYAAKVLFGPKVRAEPVLDGDLSCFGRCDVAHRPFQPNVGFDVSRWRGAADRVLVSILDLISYHIGTYSGDPDAWLDYRSTVQRIANEVDGVVVISEDVRRQLLLERLPVDPRRVFVASIGTEHLTGREEARQPPERLGIHAASEFVLCLGTNYSHKNRDLAVRACAELRRRGWTGALVMVGPTVPWGSSRVDEAIAVSDVGDELEVVTLPDLPSEERNWLLRHASLVLYPTSAEGFGLVPFEAAKFGTPTVFVGFGPLAELGGQQPVVADCWTPTSLADAAERLLADPQLASTQVEACLEAGKAHSWARAAADLTSAYRAVLDLAPR